MIEVIKDPVFWTGVALVILIAIAVRAGVHRTIAKSLDDRSAMIAKDLDDARHLREEAQALLADFQRKARDAEREAGEIVANAKRDAERLKVEAEAQLVDTIERRTRAAEAKIAQAEARAIADVRSLAVDVAIAAAEKVLSGRLKGAVSNELMDKSIAEVKARLN